MKAVAPHAAREHLAAAELMGDVQAAIGKHPIKAANMHQSGAFVTVVFEAETERAAARLYNAIAKGLQSRRLVIELPMVAARLGPLVKP